ncbi:hypothetical protein [Alteriqipengyuania lutimaris]|uniref:Uncharacterized protein n=1 Tax=Alteriqipengyuania lutimaris TaxID=1538146 RepID=A0A395LJD5_9SPHN|nr:hypothetical protein [Alteriqipengyuania lutimaris]MBB3034288.1 hypothetical protein [Alteriqipengyuania lutimaris]RDS76805.1 hypothetical protein DL238_03720 [Alteriqipengyuania lutimaris]
MTDRKTLCLREASESFAARATQRRSRAPAASVAVLASISLGACAGSPDDEAARMADAMAEPYLRCYEDVRERDIAVLGSDECFAFVEAHRELQNHFSDRASSFHDSLGARISRKLGWEREPPCSRKCLRTHFRTSLMREQFAFLIVEEVGVEDGRAYLVPQAWDALRERQNAPRALEDNSK